MKNLISVAGAAVVILTGCFGAYLVNRDSIREHSVKIEYIEKANKEQKLALEKVAANLAAVERTLAELVGELKHLKRSYNEKVSINANRRYVLRDPDDRM